MLTIEDLDDALTYSIALGHIAALLRLIELREAERPLGASAFASTASAAHLREHGHRLRFGCCRPTDDAMAA